MVKQLHYFSTLCFNEFPEEKRAFSLNPLLKFWLLYIMMLTKKASILHLKEGCPSLFLPNFVAIHTKEHSADLPIQTDTHGRKKAL